VVTVSTPTSGSSGKRLIFGVLALGILAAAASWWFRFSTTHRAANFWGPPAATLIRDAPHVTLRTDAPSADGALGNQTDVPRDISNAKGLTHLRNALLEDSSYDWAASGPPNTDWSNSLVFAAAEGSEPRAIILFSPDYKWIANAAGGDPGKHAVATTAEFSQGLNTFFAEQDQDAKIEQ
jgi:hypothetical protein